MRYAKVAGWDTSSQPAELLKGLAEQCVAAGANAIEINTQQHYDQPEAMEFAVKVAQQACDLQLCLSSNNTETLEAGLRACKRPPIVNYISVDEARLKDVLPTTARHGADVVLLVSDPASPTDAREMLQKTAILVGAANGAGIPNDRILVDPGLIHVTNENGQRHLAEVIEFLRNLPEAVDPEVRSTCWLASSSTGAPRRRRSIIETSLLPMLAGAGLSSVFLDILRRENRRAARLVKIFNNQLVYSDSDTEL
jgi:5-methyltetrahydrofolate corrinoid/iron sulfur protein methyltransferase